jgi:hypothetical protein
MSAGKGEVFVRIDDAQLQMILSQLQQTGGDRGRKSKTPADGINEDGKDGDYLPDKKKSGPYGKNGDFMPTIPRGARSAIGLALPGGYGMVREYNMVRWGQRGLFDVQSAYKGMESGKSFSAVGGYGVFTNISTFAVLTLRGYPEAQGGAEKARGETRGNQRRNVYAVGEDSERPQPIHEGEEE